MPHFSGHTRERKRFRILSRWSWTGRVTFRKKSTFTSCQIDGEGVFSSKLNRIDGCCHEKSLQISCEKHSGKKQIGVSASIKQSKAVKRSSRRKKKLEKSVKFLFTSKKMIPNVLPVEASQSSLDIFERPPLLITFDTSSEQKIGPVYAPNGPTLEFEVVGDRTIFIDLQNIYLEVKCRILRPNANKLEYDAGNAEATDAPFFVNKTLHSLFSGCSITANGIKVSSNGNYAQKTFIETEFSRNKEAKDTWLKCQGCLF